MYGIVAPKWGFPLGVATRLMLIALARSATTRGPHLGATLRAEFLWGALRRCSLLAWNNQAALLTSSTAPQRNSAIPYIKSKSALAITGKSEHHRTIHYLCIVRKDDISNGYEHKKRRPKPPLKFNHQLSLLATSTT